MVSIEGPGDEAGNRNTGGTGGGGVTTWINKKTAPGVSVGHSE